MREDGARLTSAAKVSHLHAPRWSRSYSECYAKSSVRGTEGLRRELWRKPVLGSLPYLGHNHPNVPAVRSAYTRPSNMDLSVVIHERPSQIEFCKSARL